jgi:hypothetical protein
MGINKEVEKEMKKEGFIKRNAKKSANYVKNETYTYTNMKDVLFYKGFIYQIIKVLNPFNKKEVKSRTETFENAVKRLNIKEENLYDSFKYYNLTFWLGLVLALSSLLFGGYLLLFKGNIWSLGPTIACISIGFAQMINGSFRTFQINKRELCSLSVWYNSKKFFPSSFKNTETYNKEKRMEEKKSLQRLTK